MSLVKVENNVFTGAGWFVGWLFTVGYAGLSFSQAVLAIIAWPYYLGTALGT